MFISQNDDNNNYVNKAKKGKDVMESDLQFETEQKSTQIKSMICGYEWFSMENPSKMVKCFDETDVKDRF